MQANIHTPERLAGESFEAYCARRARSHRINRYALARTSNNKVTPGAGMAAKRAATKTRNVRRHRVACR